MQDLNTKVQHAIEKTQVYLLGIQSGDGYWVGELEADASVAAGYMPYIYFMTGEIDPGKKEKIITYVRGKQREDGSWSSYYGGPGDLNVTIQIYFAHKLAGVSPDEPYMKQAKDFVIANGGVTGSSVFTKIWLALFGQFPWKGTPSMPPEIILFPNWFYFNIYEFASWSRATIVALMVVLTQKPVCPIPTTAEIPELYVEPEEDRDYSLGKINKLFSWKSFFLMADSMFKFCEKMPVKPGRKLALRKTEQWIVDHQEADGSWGGIMLPWIYSLVALKTLGYTNSHPVIAKGMAGIEDFLIEDETTCRLQPATSPVWDTAWTVIALGDSGLSADHPALAKAARWLLKEQIKIGGDWQVKNPKTEPGCWSFEFDNDLYPDIDDTAVVPRALLRAKLTGAEEEEKNKAIESGLRWVLSMQSKDGGWAAFDLDNDMRLLAEIPFAEFMTPLDPTSADVTAHAIDLMSELDRRDANFNKALSYVRKQQEADGAWYGRWGVNYVYGTGLILSSLKNVLAEMDQEQIQKAVSFLTSFQNGDGGWGESCHSYHDPTYRGIGPSTASQTAWALLGLLGAGEGNSEAVQRGISYLLETQAEDGSWHEDDYTGTGFPRAFYLKYDLYRIYFPLMALAQYQTFLKEVQGDADS